MGLGDGAGGSGRAGGASGGRRAWRCAAGRGALAVPPARPPTQPHPAPSESCSAQAFRISLPGSPCHFTLPALKPFAEGIATAECRTVALAVKTQRANLPPE